MTQQQQPQSYYYWNTSDNRDHTHHRFEWSVANHHLVCINIHISHKLLDSMKSGDIILAYEPKHHKISKDKFGLDGYCCKCIKNKSDGRQSFIGAFTLTSKPIIITSAENYERMSLKYLDSWYSHNYGEDDKNKFLLEYFKSKSNHIIVFPIELVKIVDIPTQPLNIILIKGFDKITNQSAIQNIASNVIKST